MSQRIHIIDMDDGPGGGGGAALARVLVANSITHQCWTSSTLSSGWDASPETRCIDDEALAGVMNEAVNDDVFVAGTSAALGWLRRVAESAENEISESLSKLIEMPQGVRSLLVAGDAELPVAEYEVLVKAPERKLCSKLFHGGWILTDAGNLIGVANGEEAWYRTSQLFRRGMTMCALVPALQRSLYLGSHYFVDGEIRHAAFLRVDSMRPSWRPALGRTVTGRVWQRAVDELDGLNVKHGFLQSLWLLGAGAKQARFVASSPTPSAWLGLDSDGIAAAMVGGASNGLTMADRYYADAPIDLAISCRTLMERNAHD